MGRHLGRFEGGPAPAPGKVFKLGCQGSEQFILAESIGGFYGPWLAATHAVIPVVAVPVV